MCLMRTLFYIGNFPVSVTHIPGVNNCLADALSRLQFSDQDPTITIGATRKDMQGDHGRCHCSLHA